MCAGACVGHKITNRVTKLRETSKGGGRKKMTEYRNPCDLKVGGARSIWRKRKSVSQEERATRGRKVRTKHNDTYVLKKSHNDTVILYAGIKINLKINILKQSVKIKKSHQVR